MNTLGRALAVTLGLAVLLSLMGCGQDAGAPAPKESEARRAAANLEARVATGWAGEGTTTDEWVAQQPANATAASGSAGANPTITWTFEDGSSIYAEFSIERSSVSGDSFFDERVAVVLRKYVIHDAP